MFRHHSTNRLDVLQARTPCSGVTTSSLSLQNVLKLGWYPNSTYFRFFLVSRLYCHYGAQLLTMLRGWIHSKKAELNASSQSLDSQTEPDDGTLLQTSYQDRIANQWWQLSQLCGVRNNNQHIRS